MLQCCTLFDVANGRTPPPRELFVEGNLSYLSLPHCIKQSSVCLFWAGIDGLVSQPQLSMSNYPSSLFPPLIKTFVALAGWNGLGEAEAYVTRRIMRL